MKFLERLKRIVKALSLSENIVNYINSGESLPSPFTAEEEAELVAKMESGEESVKSMLIEHNLRLVVYIARRFANTGVDLDDLISEGVGNYCFVIGGSLGVDEKVRKRANFMISFSKLTFTHQMIRMLLLEQIYRAFKINNNETYHK